MGTLMAQDDAWQRDHQRESVTPRAGRPEDARPEVERLVHGLLGWLAGDHGVVDVSVWELAELEKHPAPEVHCQAVLASPGAPPAGPQPAQL
ncbi:MAG: hypothetical protein IT370_31505 [Deltaproteobacteria bacterium]|nr:hypothetical protein [Deltaproteobacteria bacterium]